MSLLEAPKPRLLDRARPARLLEHGPPSAPDCSWSCPGLIDTWVELPVVVPRAGDQRRGALRPVRVHRGLLQWQRRHLSLGYLSPRAFERQRPPAR